MWRSGAGAVVPAFTRVLDEQRTRVRDRRQVVAALIDGGEGIAKGSLDGAGERPCLERRLGLRL